MRITFIASAILVTAVPAFSQKYEFGVYGGGSFYQSRTVTNPQGSASAGFKMGWGTGATIGHNMYEHVGGELRYSYLHNSMKVRSGSTEASFGGESHLVHYDVLFHANSLESRVRPYAAAGGGFKYYRGTGTEVAFQPLSNIAILTKTSQVQGMVSVGGGIKIKLTNKMMFRADVHDYLNPFPKNVIAPASGSKVSGWINNIVPMAGVTWTF